MAPDFFLRCIGPALERQASVKQASAPCAKEQTCLELFTYFTTVKNDCLSTAMNLCVVEDKPVTCYLRLQHVVTDQMAQSAKAFPAARVIAAAEERKRFSKKILLQQLKRRDDSISPIECPDDFARISEASGLPTSVLCSFFNLMIAYNDVLMLESMTRSAEREKKR